MVEKTVNAAPAHVDALRETRWQDEPFFEADHPFDLFEQSTGRFTRMALANAIQMWDMLQDGTGRTVAETAKAFNIAEWKVREAVAAHPWLFLVGDRIEHEGE